MKSKNIQRIIILGILFLFANQARAEDWTYYDTALAGTMYYDKSSIFEAKKGIISVWTKNILSTDSKKQYFSILEKIDKAPDDPSKLSYYKSLMEIDCTNKKFRYIYAVFYDEQDNIIHPSSENETSAWNTIEPDSVGEKLMNLVSAESAISKETDVAKKVETPVTPEETVAVAKAVEPVPPKETAPVVKVTEPVAPKETVVTVKVEKPVPPKETAITTEGEKPVPLKETVVDTKVEKPVPSKETVVAAKVDKPAYPKETVLAARIAESIPPRETPVAAKVMEPAPPKETVVAALAVPDKKLIPVETGQKPENREVQDQKSKSSADNRPPVPATARETGRDGRFIAFDNQTVLDTKTNLIWAAKDNGRDINWYDAKRYCQTYRGGGYTDWRMPTKDELAQLYDARKTQRYEAQQNPLHLTELIRLSDCCPWSSQTRGSEAAYFDFSNGTHWWFLSPGTSINRVLPVREVK